MSGNEELQARRAMLSTWRASLRAVERERLDASWALALDATDEARARYKETLEAVDDWYADTERYEKLTNWKRAPLDEKVMDREVRVLAIDGEVPADRLVEQRNQQLVDERIVPRSIYDARPR